MFREYWEYILGELNGIVARMAEALPRVLVALVIVVVTLLVAKLVKSITTKLLRALGINVLSKKAGIDRYLEPAKLASGVSGLVGVLLYWILVFLGLTYALGVVGFAAAQTLVGNIVLYLPRVLISIIILVIGVYASAFLGGMAERAAAGAHILYARWVGWIVKAVVLLITAVSIVEELSVNVDFIKVFFFILLGGAATALTVVFGIGGIPLGREILASVAIRQTIGRGDRIIWKDRDVTVEEVKAVFTRLSDDGRSIHVRNSALAESGIVVTAAAPTDRGALAVPASSADPADRADRGTPVDTAHEG